MTLQELLAELSTRKARVRVVDGKLKIQAPEGAVTPELRRTIKKHKDALLDVLSQAAGLEHKTEVLPIKRIRNRQYRSLSFSQERLWILGQLEPDSSFYNIPAAIRATGRSSRDVVWQCLNDIVRRHEGLRTVFLTRNASPYQKIGGSGALVFPLVDISDLKDKENRLSILITRAAQLPFKLEKGPLFYACCICVNEAEYAILINMHHIVSDGWSIGILIQEIGKTYSDIRLGNPSSLEELQVQVIDYSIWQRKEMAGNLLEEELNYWAKKLDDAPKLIELPWDRPRPLVETHRGRLFNFLIEEKMAGKLNELANQFQTTLYVVLCAMFNILLHHYSGQDDICLGTPIAGRNHRVLESLIGFFANTLTIRSKISFGQKISDYLEQMKHSIFEIFEHRDVPFDKIVERVNPVRSPSHNPIFQTAFAMQNFARTELDLPGLQLRGIESEHNSSQFDLSLQCFESANGIFSIFEYSTDLFDEDTVREMSKDFRSLMEAIVAEPNQNMEQLLKGMPKKKIDIGIVATFTADPIEEPIYEWMYSLGIPCKVNFGRYAQVFQELLNPSSVLVQNSFGVNLILVRLEDWCGDKAKTMSEQIMHLEENVREFTRTLVEVGRKRFPLTAICLCPHSDAYAGHDDFVAFAEKMAVVLEFEVKNHKKIVFVNCMRIPEWVDLEPLNDANTDKLGHIPYTENGFWAIAGNFVRALSAKFIRYPSAVVCSEDLFLKRSEDENAVIWGDREVGEEVRNLLCKQKLVSRQVCLWSPVMGVFSEKKKSESEGDLEKDFDDICVASSVLEAVDEFSRKSEIPHRDILFLSSDEDVCRRLLEEREDILAVEVPKDDKRKVIFLKRLWCFDPGLAAESVV